MTQTPSKDEVLRMADDLEMIMVSTLHARCLIDKASAMLRAYAALTQSIENLPRCDMWSESSHNGGSTIQQDWDKGGEWVRYSDVTAALSMRGG